MQSQRSQQSTLVTPETSRPARAGREIPSALYWLVAFGIGSSFYVAAEPAVTDLLFLLLLVAVLFKKDIRFPLDLNPILSIGLLGFLTGSAVSLVGSQDFGRAVFYFAVTTYLLVCWYILVTLLGNYGPPMCELISRAFLVAAVLAAIVGLLSHFSPIIQDNLGLGSYGVERAQSTFKDPNVYGPFLCAALLLVINDMVTRRFLSIISLALLGLFSVEILAAFSRGAFVSLAVSLFVYFSLVICLHLQRDSLTRSFIIIVVGSLLVVAVSVVFLRLSGLEDFLDARLRLQHYDSDRFSNQLLAIATMAETPFGIGPGQSEVLLPRGTHNVYIRILAENGIISMLFWLLLLMSIMWINVRGAWRRGPFQDAYVSCLAILAGIVVNGLVIDTLHWRHFFMFLALPIGLDRYERWQAQRRLEAPMAPITLSRARRERESH